MMKRRDFLRLVSVGGGAVFASGLAGRALADYGGDKQAQAYDEFYFVQLSDTHWGYKGPANPDAANTLKKAVAAVNALETRPDFIVFTGDLTHTTDDTQERRRRLAEFRDIVSELKVKNVRFMPGEHDASLDNGAVYKELFGDTHYTFDHKGVHFIALDNVSDPGARIGDAQLEWLKADLSRQKKNAPIVVLTHRPLFDLAPQWDWATRDGAKAVDLLMPYTNVTVFYGHIHQEHHHRTGHIAHHSAKSLIFPLPAPASGKARAAGLGPCRAEQGTGFGRSKEVNDALQDHRTSGEQGLGMKALRLIAVTVGLSGALISAALGRRKAGQGASRASHRTAFHLHAQRDRGEEGSTGGVGDFVGGLSARLQCARAQTPRRPAAWHRHPRALHAGTRGGV